jgi:protein-S-isoprenylcysteine O-methyltransferase Ste14
MSEEPDDHPGVLIFPPLLWLICVVVGLIAHFVSYDHWAIGRWARGGGVALALAGFAFAFWGRRVMKASGTNIRPDMPALAVVSDGPFAFTRNPLYLSLITMFAGIGIALASPAFLFMILPLAVVLHAGVVRREERYLEAKFGDAYRAYKARVRRWI